MSRDPTPKDEPAKASADAFGRHVRSRREALREAQGKAYSQRSVAERLGVSHVFLGMVERGEQVASESLVRALASELGEDEDEMMTRAGRVPAELGRLVAKRPRMLDALRALEQVPDDRLEQVVQKIREGEW